METEKPQPKIDGMEAFFMVALCLVFDTVDFLATFLDGFFGAGEVIKFFNNIIASTTMFLWVMMKDISPLWTLAGGGLELMPVVNALPIRTATMAVTVWLDRHPHMAEVIAHIAPIKNPKRMLSAKKMTATKNPKTTQAA